MNEDLPQEAKAFDDKTSRALQQEYRRQSLIIAEADAGDQALRDFMDAVLADLDGRKD